MVEAVAASGRIPRRLLVIAIARVLAVTFGTLLVYFLIPIQGETAAYSAVGACVGIAIILVVFARQISRVSRSQRPVMAAVEALVLVFGLFTAFFALLYVSVATSNPQAFTEDIDKVAGIYFTTTVLTTVGFGDITPVNDLARGLVTVQMVLGAALIGTALKALGFSAKRAVNARTTSVAAPTPDAGSAEADPGNANAGG
jgi:hypothetical protein